MSTNSRDAKTAMKHFFSLATVVLAASAMLTNPLYYLQDPDTLWHTVVGLDMMKNMSFPTVDTYSYTFEGHRWIAHEWFGEIIHAAAYYLLGWNGVVLATVLSIAITSGLFVYFLSKDLRPTISVGLVFIILFLMSPNYNSRPYIFIFPIIVVWTFQMFRASAEGRSPPFWLLLLLVLWVNLHATFVLGFIIAFFAFLDYLMRFRFSDRAIVGKWIGFGLLCPVLMLINPYGIEPFYEVLSMASSNEAVQLINEWRPFTTREYPLHALSLALLIFGLIASGYQTSMSRAACMVFSLFLFLSYIRFTFFFLLTFPIVAAHGASKSFPRMSSETWRRSETDPVENFILKNYRALKSALTLILAATVGLFVAISEVEPVRDHFAKPAIEFATSSGLTEGRVLNSYNFGGTLIFHGIKTFIDGRTDQLFGDGFVTLDDDMGKTGGRKLIEDTIKKYEISWAILTSTDLRVPFFEEMENWEKVYEDEYTFIFKAVSQQ